MVEVFEVQAPWLWFWLPVGQSPVLLDPNGFGSTGYSDAGTLAWGSVAAAAAEAIRTAQASILPGEYPSHAAVPVEGAQQLTGSERSILRSWLADEPVCLFHDVKGTWTVDQGRHRLWGAQTAAQAGPALIPVQDGNVFGLPEMLDRLTPRAARALRAHAAWWRSGAPEAVRAVNSEHIARVAAVDVAARTAS